MLALLVLPKIEKNDAEHHFRKEETILSLTVSPDRYNSTQQ